MQICRLYIENIFDVVVDEFFNSFFSMDVKLAEVNLLGVNPPLYSQNVWRKWCAPLYKRMSATTRIQLVPT